MISSQRRTGSGPGRQRLPVLGTASYALLFSGLSFYLFLTSSRVVNVFDEGIALTASMRALAGQVPHRDFYYNYGPAHMYLVAGLFKLFGTSVLVARLEEVFTAALAGAAAFAIARRTGSRAMAALVLLLCILWPGSLGLMSLFPFCATWLLAGLFQRDLPRRAVAAAGVMVGLTALFRYDIGVGVVAAHLLTMALAVSLRHATWRERMVSFGRALWPYLAGVAIIVVPLTAAYAAAGALPDLLYDVVLYNAKYYRAGRGLPFPSVHRTNAYDLVVYLFPLLIGLGFLQPLVSLSRRRVSRENEAWLLPRWAGELLAFSAVAAVMYLKALVRIGAGQLAMTTLPCIMIAALLFEHRTSLSTTTRAVATLLLGLFMVAGAAFVLESYLQQHRQRVSTLDWMLRRPNQQPLPPFQGWCQQRNPLTRGFCFVLDDDHIQAVKYLREQTRPADTLYVGLPQHDRIFAGDSITYFAAERLPAVKWTQFDPFLENRADIQQEMIGELEQNRPPYAVLDSEFQDVREPNGSAMSTGVHLLDDYLAAHYMTVCRFGELTIMKRRPAAAQKSSTTPE